MVYWGLNTIISLLLPKMISGLKISGTFTIFAIACSMGAIFIFRVIKETKGVSINEIINLYRTDLDSDDSSYLNSNYISNTSDNQLDY